MVSESQRWAGYQNGAAQRLMPTELWLLQAGLTSTRTTTARRLGTLSWPHRRSTLAYLAQKGVDTTYTLTQLPHAPEVYRTALEDAAAQRAAGVAVTPQVPVRPTGMLYGPEILDF